MTDGFFSEGVLLGLQAQDPDAAPSCTQGHACALRSPRAGLWGPLLC